MGNFKDSPFDYVDPESGDTRNILTEGAAAAGVKLYQLCTGSRLRPIIHLMAEEAFEIDAKLVKKYIDYKKSQNWPEDAVNKHVDTILRPAKLSSERDGQITRYIALPDGVEDLSIDASFFEQVKDANIGGSTFSWSPMFGNGQNAGYYDTAADQATYNSKLLSAITSYNGFSNGYQSTGGFAEQKVVAISEIYPKWKPEDDVYDMMSYPDAVEAVIKWAASNPNKLVILMQWQRHEFEPVVAIFSNPSKNDSNFYKNTSFVMLPDLQRVVVMKGALLEKYKGLEGSEYSKLQSIVGGVKTPDELNSGSSPVVSLLPRRGVLFTMPQILSKYMFDIRNMREMKIEGVDSIVAEHICQYAQLRFADMAAWMKIQAKTKGLDRNQLSQINNGIAELQKRPQGLFNFTYYGTPRELIPDALQYMEIEKFAKKSDMSVSDMEMNTDDFTGTTTWGQAQKRVNSTGSVMWFLEINDPYVTHDPVVPFRGSSKTMSLHWSLDGQGNAICKLSDISTHDPVAGLDPLDDEDIEAYTQEGYSWSYNLALSQKEDPEKFVAARLGVERRNDLIVNDPTTGKALTVGDPDKFNMDYSKRLTDGFLIYHTLEEIDKPLVCLMNKGVTQMTDVATSIIGMVDTSYGYAVADRSTYPNIDAGDFTS